MACWLHYNDVPLTGHTRENNRSVFTFSGEEIEGLIFDYTQGSAMVNIADYSRAQRQLKNVMYSGTSYQPNNEYERNISTK